MDGFIRFGLWVMGLLLVAGLFCHFLVFDDWVVPNTDPKLNVSIEPDEYGSGWTEILDMTTDVTGWVENQYLSSCG